jgi:hypothetical protein
MIRSAILASPASRLRLAAAALFAIAALASQSASAQTPEYVGTWATQAAQCRLGQESQDAPMIIRRDGYDQHEAHCTFKSISKRGTTWTALASCMVEGDTQELGFTMQVAGNRLTIRDEFGTRVLTRCR